MDNNESPQERIFTKEEALQEIEMIWQQICQTGNVDIERNVLDQIIEKMNSGKLTPNEAVEEAYRVMNGRVQR